MPSLANVVREKFTKLLEADRKQPRMDPGQLMLVALLLKDHDTTKALEYLDVAADRLLDRDGR